MRVSVVIPVYNGARFLADTLDSVVTQSRPPDEIIAVDDGSTDDSAAIVARYPGVRCIHQANGGCAAARNRGVEAATHELVAFGDHDDIWMPDRLQRTITIFEQDPAIGIVASAIQNFLTPGIAAPPSALPAGEAEARLHGMGTNTIVVRRSVFERIGPFDSSMVPIDDTEWLTRALDAGVGFWHIGEPLVRRRIHDRNLSVEARGTPALGALMARVLHASLVRRRAAGK